MTPSPKHYLEPATQLANLGQDRLLVRHRLGVGVLNGLQIDDLANLLGYFDGRNLDQILNDCPYHEDDVCAIVAKLFGTVLVETAPPPISTAPLPQARQNAPILVLGNGPLAASLLKVNIATGEQGFLDLAQFACGKPGRNPDYRDFLPQPSIAHIDSASLKMALKTCRLLVCAPETVGYGVWKELQATALALGVPFLPVRLEPDGLRLGPMNIPGHSACLDCALRLQMRFLGSWPPALDALRTTRLRTDLPDGFNTLYKNELARLMDGKAPELLDRVVLFGHRGGNTHTPWERDCPTCGGYDPKPRAEVFDVAAQRISRFEAGNKTSRSTAENPGRIGILGGGTAGYLAALALAKRFPGLDLTLIESSKVPVIGVGEATTPLMPQFLHNDLGLDIHDLFEKVRPTFKLGIRFLWGEAKSGVFNYPFGPVQPLEALCYERGILDYSFQSMAMNARKIPIDARGNSLLHTETAYHLENRRLVAWLQKAAAKRGIRVVDATIVAAEKADDGQTITALVDEENRRHCFDTYIDCSGFRSFLIEETLGSGFVDFKTSLFTDRAVIAAVPRSGSPLPYTVAESMNAGWCWNTPQIEEDHRGYVFSSAFLDDDQAVNEMRKVNPGMGLPRVIGFRAGRHQHFWKGNVFALGNAYGFVEPLESTALHMLIRQIGLMLRLLPANPCQQGIQVMANRKVAGWWDYLRWFLAIHYKYNRRVDSPFWRACQQEVDISAHEELVRAFQERGPLSADQNLVDLFDYPDPLWGPEGIDTILAGQKLTCHLPNPTLSQTVWRRYVDQCQYLLNDALPQDKALALIQQRPELLARLARAFKAKGSAFIK